jgi:polysaccharide deacetylase 2 family uncharacterized protein YibQ
MTFLDTVERARSFLQRNERLSLRALQREFDLDQEALEELIEELVDIEQVARRNGKALEWAGPAEDLLLPRPCTSLRRVGMVCALQNRGCL